MRDFFGDAGVVGGEVALECGARVGGVETKGEEKDNAETLSTQRFAE